MNRVSDVIINLFGREYDVGFCRWAGGGPALFLVNRETGAVLPVGMDASLKSPDAPETLVTNIDGIPKSLVGAGIVKEIGDEGRWGMVMLTRCEIVHPQILAELAGMKRNEPAATWSMERDGM